VAVVRDGKVAAIAELRCETDFVAKSDDFVSLVDEIAARVAAEGEGATAQFEGRIETLLTTLKENISLGRVYRLEAGEDEVVDTYIHLQSGRGVNAVAVVVKGGVRGGGPRGRGAHRLHQAAYLTREEVPASEVEAERRPSRRSRATRASPRRRCPRSSRAVSTAGSRTGSCSSSPT
jgi:elongation factor Ts